MTSILALKKEKGISLFPCPMPRLTTRYTRLSLLIVTSFVYIYHLTFLVCPLHAAPCGKETTSNEHSVNNPAHLVQSAVGVRAQWDLAISKLTMRSHSSARPSTMLILSISSLVPLIFSSMLCTCVYTCYLYQL